MPFLRKGKQNNKQPRSRGRGAYLFNSGQKVVLNSKGLTPVVLQHAESREVLHLGYMDRWALNTSLEHNIVYLYRRSSNRLEKFGEHKNLEYKINSVKLDQSKRSLLLSVLPSQDNLSGTSFIHDIEIGTKD